MPLAVPKSPLISKKKLASPCLILTAAIGLALCNTAQAQPKPTLALDFENGIGAINSEGKPVAGRVLGKLEAQPGRFGNALRSGPSAAGLSLPTKGILSSQAGTVEMWVNPLDWSGNDGKFHVFFDTHGEDALSLYKHPNGKLLMLRKTGPSYITVGSIGNWKPGEWHHLAATWSPLRNCIYVDGKLAAAFRPIAARALGGSFTIGDGDWAAAGPKRASGSLIDQVRIYDRALSPEHIAAHFAGDYSKVVPLTEHSSLLGSSINPDTKRLVARAELLGDTTAAAPQVSFALAAKNGGAGKIPVAGMRPFIGSVATASFSLAGLKPGDYELSATIDSVGQAPIRLARTVPVLSLEWQGKNTGNEDKVLAPWTPVKISRDKNSLSAGCWGRSYEFGKAALPVQIVSKGEALLARPMSLDLMVAGRRVQWVGSSNKLSASSPTGADIEGWAYARVASGKIELRTRMRLEYDGLMTLDFGLNVPPGVTVDSISLDVPLRSEVSFYRHRWGGTGALPAGKGVIDSSKFDSPFYWIGDNDRGLLWFCESGKNWPNFAGKNASQTVREGGAVILRSNLLVQGQKLPRNWRYQCGFQATPVKPLPRDWRKWRMHPAKGANIFVLWPYPEKDSLKYYGYPQAADPEIFAKRVKAYQDQGMKVVPYSCLASMSIGTPEWQWFGPRWDSTKSSPLDSIDPNWDVAAFGSLFEPVSAGVSSYQDFIIWKNQQFMERYNFDGYYHDLTSTYPCMNDEAGCGWRDETGAVQPSFDILGLRKTYQRLYSVAKTKDPNSFLMGHMSGAVFIPMLAYEDAYLDGELLQNVQDDYLDVVSLDTFRAEFMGRQWGPMPFFLPELTGVNRSREEPTKGLFGLLLIHDVMPWNTNCNIKVMDDAFEALDAFGYVDSDFIPYFDPTPPVVTDMKDVYASVYKRSDGRALVIIANTSKTERSGTIRLNSGRIGLPLDSVVNWPGKTPLSRDANGAIKLTLAGQGYQMLLIGTAP